MRNFSRADYTIEQLKRAVPADVPAGILSSPLNGLIKRLNASIPGGVLRTTSGCGATYIGSGEGGKYIISARHCGTPTYVLTDRNARIRVTAITDPSLDYRFGRDYMILLVNPEDEDKLEGITPIQFSDKVAINDALSIKAPLFREEEDVTVSSVAQDQYMKRYATPSFVKESESPWATISTKGQYGKVRPGYSGSPALDEDDRFAGIVSTSARNFFGYQTSELIQADTVKNVLEGYGIRNYGGESYTRGAAGYVKDKALATRVALELSRPAWGHQTKDEIEKVVASEINATPNATVDEITMLCKERLGWIQTGWPD